MKIKDECLHEVKQLEWIIIKVTGRLGSVTNGLLYMKYTPQFLICYECHTTRPLTDTVSSDPQRGSVILESFSRVCRKYNPGNNQAL